MTENAAAWFVDRHAAEGRGEKVAFRNAADGESLTYGELVGQTGLLGHALLRDGLRREERAAMIVTDRLEFPVVFWGALKAGIVPIPMNTMLSGDIYAALLEDSRAAIAFVSIELWPTAEAALRNAADLRRIVVIGAETAPNGTIRYEDFVVDAEPIEPVECSADEVAFWLYSSGSTGVPKGVRHVHGALKVTSDTYGAEVLGVRPDDIVFSAAKLFFAYGLGNGMSFPMSVGATTVLFDGRPTPDSVSDVLSRYRPTVYCGVPTLYAALLHHWEGKAPPDAPLRTCISAGEALPGEIGVRWKGLWGVDILDGVGSTEMLHIFLSNRPGDVEYGTSGLPVPGYDLRLVDETGAEVAPGQVGELLVRGASSACDYWLRRDKSRQTFEGEWTRTGDKYERTEDGRYIYCGRTDDMFKVSGIWVSPFEVEQALVSHAAVLEAAVVACADEDGLEKPKAFVVVKDEITTDLVQTLQAHVKQKVGKWKYPRWVEVVDDLPKTATGKIQRFKLREMA